MSELPEKPNHLPPKPGGRVWHEEDQEALMTDIFANRIEEQILITHKFLRREVASVRVIDHAGWDKRSIVITFTDGSALGVSGHDLEVHDFPFNPTDEQLFEAASRDR